MKIEVVFNMTSFITKSHLQIQLTHFHVFKNILIFSQIIKYKLHQDNKYSQYFGTNFR